MSDPRQADTSAFPDPTYTRTVLKPLFDSAKGHHVDGFRAIDQAHLVMLNATGILDAPQARAIAGALAEIENEVDPTKLEYTGEVEDYFFQIEKELKLRLGPDLGGRLHTARSRNDIDHTLFKLGLKPRIDKLLEQGRNLLEAMIATARRESGTLVVAYTHGQPAQASTFDHYLGAAVEVLIRDMERLEAARAIVDLSPMGAAAITTTGFPIDRALVARLLGFAAPLQNSYGCIASVDYTTSTYSAIELMFLHFGRLLQDFQFWTAFEVGQLYVPHAFVQISSIMPQKRNPVPIEHMRLLTSQTVGRAQAMLTIMHNTPFTDMNDSEGETQAFGYPAFDSAGRVLELAAAFIGAVRIDSARVAENIRRSCITVTELADTLVRAEDLSFRQAHEIAAVVAKSVVAHGGGLAEDGYGPFREAFAQVAGRKTGIDEPSFRDIVSPENFVAVRERFGGPGPEALAAALDTYSDALAGFSDRAAQRATHEAEATAERMQRLQALLEAR